MQNVIADKPFPFLISPCMLVRDENIFCSGLTQMFDFVQVLKGERNCGLCYW